MASPRVSGFGRVKSVLSGDTVILIGASADPNAPFPEKQIRFTGVIAPRLSRSKNQTDEPYAYEARECLRKLVIGKIVSFYTGKGNSDAPSDRQYGTLYIGTQSVTEVMLRAGLLTCKESDRKSPEREALSALEQEAKSAGRGIWSQDAPEDHVRNVDWNPDVRALFAQYKGQQVPAVVSQVRDGSVIRCEVSAGKNKWNVVSLTLAGASSPRTLPSMGYRQAEYQRRLAEDPDNAGPPPSDSDLPPFSQEAVTFVEQRLLHRDVKLVFHAADKANNLYGAILFPEGDITTRLLQVGLAKFVPWTTPKALFSTLAAHATAAKEKGLGIYSLPDAPEVVKPRAETFTGQVTYIQSGDLVVCEVDGKDVRYALASIRAKRLGNSRRNEPDQPYSIEAKEMLRKKLIGKTVTIQPEYTRENSDMNYASIFLGSENVSEGLVQCGYAEVIPHRQNEDRACNYARLLELEMEAMTAKIGIHSKAPYKRPNIVDFTIRAPRKKNNDNAPQPSRDNTKARQFLNSIKKDKMVIGVVEYCFSASRLKVFLPKHNCMIVLVLAGVRTPTAGEPYADEANKYVKSRVLQHTVRLDIETVDRGDNFIGSLFSGSANMAVRLLEEGLATIFEFSASKSDYYTDLIKAENSAKEKKLKVFENYVEKKVEDEEGEGANTAGLKDIMEVEVVDVSDPISLFVRTVDDPNIAIVEKLMEEFNAEGEKTAFEQPPSKGQIIAAKYHMDDLWYRVRYDGIEKSADGPMHKVFFIDYGNPEVIPKERLAVLPDSISKIPGLARGCVLAGIKAPSKSSEHFHEAAVAFNNLAFNEVLVGKVELIAGGKIHLTLREKGDESGLSINQIMVQEGWCRVLERPDRKLVSLCAELTKDEDMAKEARVNIWEYGDVSDVDSDEETNNSRPRNDGRPPRRNI